ncbi:MAG: glycoside hydrolase [Thermoproteota archaeon]|nr:glycoside hydrolase [Thermoproteota archaeon]
MTYFSYYSYDSSQYSYSQPTQSINNNNTFDITSISDNERDSVYPQTESSGNNVYVTWQDNLFGHNRLNYDILLKTSSDGGKTFGEVINLSNNTGFSEHPQMAVNGSNVHIVWADNTKLNRDIYIISSSDGGKTFGEVINLSNNTADSYNQEISVD